MKRYCINGAFLSEKKTGIHRFAEEIIKALDSLVEDDLDIVLVVPKHTLIPFSLKNIRILEFGFLKGIPWEQTFFALYALIHRRIPINLCNVTPLLVPRGYSVIHDISYKVNPQYFSHWYGLLSRKWHCLNYWIITHFARHIFTVSNFSKKEIEKIYKTKPSQTTVIPNGWQHMLYVEPANDDVFSKYQLEKNNYFLSLSTIAPNKNLGWVLQTAKNNPHQNFAIAGSLNPTRFGSNLNLNELRNVKFLGYISDNEFVSLAKNSKAFIFPSFYEGFGLPPLEAMAVGAKVIVSNIEVLKDIFEDSAHYIEPHITNTNLNDILSKDVSSPSNTLKKFNWIESARKMKECFRT